MQDGTPKRLVLFVPGIMGSELRFRGPGELGEQVDEEVWGSDPSVILDVLARRPLRLRSPHLQATDVIKQIRGRVYGKKVDEALYGPILDFCINREGLALEPETEFVPFAYDWRMDNRQSADRLAVRIKQADPQGNRPIGLVAHSMGGVVCRLLLLTHQSISSRVHFFLQIASPILGSAKAFHTLREGPAFSRAMDLLIGLNQLRDLQSRSDLTAVLRTFPSIYQLLPPARVLTLVTSTGRQLAAVSDEAWLEDSRANLEAAREVHVMLEKPLSVPITCVYSNCHKTDWFYRVDAEFRIKALFQESFGDGTVVCTSAFEGTAVESRMRIAAGATLHDELPCHTQVKDALRSLVGQMSSHS